MILRRIALRAAIACALALPAPAYAWEGVVSWYGRESGRKTANGEDFDGTCDDTRAVPCGCAHWTLRFGTVVRVTDPATGRSLLCRVNDRGPHPRLRRVLDLPHEAAGRLGILRRGLIRARLTVLGPGAGRLHLAEAP